MGIDHYENFPVASWLCPPHLRPAIVAIYRFARTADDIADEGEASADQRTARLLDYSRDLDALYSGLPTSRQWPSVFAALGRSVQAHALPVQPLRDLLDAFRQDAGNPRYKDRAALLDYCRRSANPVGRLLLHLYGIDNPDSVARSDAVCTALQLINFWQDMGVDLPRGRIYLPDTDLAAHGLDVATLFEPARSDDVRRMTRGLCEWARDLMTAGAPLALEVPGRAGWELRLVVQGGLRILDHIAAQGHLTLQQRPRIAAFDAPLLAWRALTMRAGRPPR